MSDMSSEQRMAAVIERLTKLGFADTFRGELGGVRAVRSGHLHSPEELTIESINRFEGASDPDDQVIVLAVASATDDCRGTYTVPYGKDMSIVDSDLISRIPDKRAARA
jgi:hypothetical protein